MENIDLLDVDDEVHMFCLRHVFLPRINMSFMSSWNPHPLSSEGGLSPNQLWISGLSRTSVDGVISEVIDCDNKLFVCYRGTSKLLNVIMTLEGGGGVVLKLRL